MLINDFEAFLASLIDDSTLIGQAMNYALMGKGKRLRPLLLLSMLEDSDINAEYGFSCASAIEFIHTYSLIHDDLPAMDNDDLRRGRKTVHKQFDEATAILAGDALLTEAFGLISKADYNDAHKALLIRILAECAGYKGMIQGQMMDMALTNAVDVDPEILKQMEINKTGKLLAAPLMCAAVLLNHHDLCEQMLKIGETLGVAFQIQDDVLDYTSTAEEMGKSVSDKDNNKNTFYTLYGEQKCRILADQLYDSVLTELKSLPVPTDRVRDLINQMRERRK